MGVIEDNWKASLAEAATQAQALANLVKNLSDTAPTWPPPVVVEPPPPNPTPASKFPTTRNGYLIGVDDKMLIPLGTNTLCRPEGTSVGAANYMADNPDTIRQFGMNFIRLGMSEGDQARARAGLHRDIETLTKMGVYSTASWWTYTKDNKNPLWSTVLSNTTIMAMVNECLDRYKDNPYFVWNLLNEPWQWIGENDQAWASHVAAQYDWLRNRGVKGLIVCDMASWAQQIERTTIYKNVVKDRPGLALSWHLYSNGGTNDGLRDSWVKAMRDNGVPFMLGEFGAHWDLNSTVVIDTIKESDRRATARWVMSRALPMKIGGIWWTVGWTGYPMSLRLNGAAPWDTRQPLSHWGNEMMRLGRELASMPKISV